jgi:glycerate dehydrogenase
VANRLIPVYHEIAGLTWGIVGYGNIGKQVAQVARALGCRVIAHSRTEKEGVECVDLDTLCAQADIISLHTPLSEQTRGLISQEKIAKMKPTALVINVARGAVWDEAAITQAIRSRRLGGIGCDVYSTEPFSKDHPFAALIGRDNVCLTPHMAWGAYEARVRCLSEICENIRAFFAGEIRNRVEL